MCSLLFICYIVCNSFICSLMFICYLCATTKFSHWWQCVMLCATSQNIAYCISLSLHVITVIGKCFQQLNATKFCAIQCATTQKAPNGCCQYCCGFSLHLWPSQYFMYRQICILACIFVQLLISWTHPW